LIDPNEIHEKLVTLGEEWADAQAAAELLEETKKPLLSQLSTECNEQSAAAKEAFALRHPDYRKHIEIQVKARKAANKAKVRFDGAKVWVDLLRTQNANERATNRSAP